MKLTKKKKLVSILLAIGLLASIILPVTVLGSVLPVSAGDSNEETREAGLYEIGGGYEYVFDNGDVVEIGDLESADFQPYIKLNRWGGECWLALMPANLVEEEVEYEVEGDKIKCKYKVKQGEFEFEWENEFYPLEPKTVIAKDKDGKDVFFTQNELGGFEFEIILKEKPVSNQSVLNIETQGLKFYYQPELTAEEIEQGCIRPDNVVGSYAVYHATRTNMHTSKEDAEKYKCGKAFHWYRPLVWDSSSPRKEVWGELNVDAEKGIRTVTIPQEFLDSAIYPVTIDDDFGYKETGAILLITKAIIAGGVYTGAAGTANSITAALYHSIGIDQTYAFALYKNSDKSLVGQTAEETEQITDWRTLTFGSPPTIEAVDYGIVAWGTDAAGDHGIYYDSGTGIGRYYRDLAYTGTFPNPFGGNVYAAENVSIYCTYTPGDGAPDPPTNFVASENQADKVTCTWTKSDGATKYQIYRDGNPIGGELGDVDTWDDFTAEAPTITPGDAVASDGTSTAHIALSVDGEGTNNGTLYSYKVRAGSATGWSGDSNLDNGHREPGSITYQWQRSAADSDADYSNIDGATTDPYNDIGAPANGDGRYYCCEVSATGTVTQSSTHDRGYRTIVPTVTNSTADDILETTATLYGEITNIDVGNCNIRGFVWDNNTFGNPGDTAPNVSDYEFNWTESDDYDLGIFDYGVTDLDSEITYYFRACVHNLEGWSYSNELSFTTLNHDVAEAIKATSHSILWYILPIVFVLSAITVALTSKKPSMIIGAIFIAIVGITMVTVLLQIQW